MAEKKQLSKKPHAAKQPQAKINKPITGKKLPSQKFLLPFILFITCFVLYGNTLQNGYTLDDGIYTNKNEFISKGFSAFKDIFDKGSLYGVDRTTASQYRPLTLLNFMAETSIFGLNPHASHFFNILFFAFTVILLFFFLQKILKNYNQAIVIAASLLFLFHPIHTEVVASIKSRDEILGMLFGLLSFYFILLHEEKNSPKYYFFSLVSFCAAIFCKENCLTFVVIIPLLLYFFTSLEIKKIVLKSLPYLGLVAFYLFIRSLVLKNMTFTDHLLVMDNALMSASNNADKIATCFVLLGKYIYMTIIPYPLSWDYSYNQIPIVSWGNIEAIISLLAIAALIGYAIFGLKGKSIYSFLIAWFFITLLLSSNLLVKIASTFGERFLYVPSLSFCIALPILVAKAVKLNPSQAIWQNRNKFYIPIACLLGIYLLIVIPRNKDWKNDYALFSAGIVTSPNSARAHLALAEEYGNELKQSRTREEHQQLSSLDMQETYRSLAIYNKYPQAYFNLGSQYLQYKGMGDSAQIMFEKTLALKPGHIGAANNLGLIYAQKVNYTEAAKWFHVALKIDSTFSMSLMNLAIIYEAAGHLDTAAYYYTRLLKITPNDTSIRHSLFNIYFTLGKGYFNKDEYPQALTQFTLANSYNPQSAEATGYLGAIYQSEHNLPMAEEYYRKSLEINPNNTSVSRNLQEVLELENRN